MTSKKAPSNASFSVVEPLCQVAAYNAKLLVLLMDASVARLWNGGGGDAERSSAVANSDMFKAQHAGWLPLGLQDDTQGRAIVLSLDDESDTLDIYHLGKNRLALFGPGHTQLQARASSPIDASERVFERLGLGPTADATLAGHLNIKSDLMIVEHNLDTSDLAPRTLRLGPEAPFKVLDDSGSALVQLAPGTYDVLIEPAAFPWRENNADRIAFIVPANDTWGRDAKPGRLDSAAQSVGGVPSSRTRKLR